MAKLKSVKLDTDPLKFVYIGFEIVLYTTYKFTLTNFHSYFHSFF